MVKVEQQLDVGRADLRAQQGRGLRRIDKIARHVVPVNRLEQQRAPGARRQRRRPAQVGEQRLAIGLRIGPVGNDARHHVQAGHRQRLGVDERPFEPGHEFRFAPRQRGQPAFARRPVAGRQIEERHFDAGGLRPRRHLRRGIGVGKMEFDGREPRSRRGGETLGERHFGKQHRQVGGKTRHATNP